MIPPIGPPFIIPERFVLFKKNVAKPKSKSLLLGLLYISFCLYHSSKVISVSIIFWQNFLLCTKILCQNAYIALSTSFIIILDTKLLYNKDKFTLTYTAGASKKGNELMIFSNNLKNPRD